MQLLIMMNSLLADECPVGPTTERGNTFKDIELISKNYCENQLKIESEIIKKGNQAKVCDFFGPDCLEYPSKNSKDVKNAMKHFSLVKLARQLKIEVLADDSSLAIALYEKKNNVEVCPVEKTSKVTTHRLNHGLSIIGFTRYFDDRTTIDPWRNLVNGLQVGEIDKEKVKKLSLSLNEVKDLCKKKINLENFMTRMAPVFEIHKKCQSQKCEDADYTTLNKILMASPESRFDIAKTFCRHKLKKEINQIVYDTPSEEQVVSMSDFNCKKYYDNCIDKSPLTSSTLTAPAETINSSVPINDIKEPVVTTSPVPTSSPSSITTSALEPLPPAAGDPLSQNDLSELRNQIQQLKDQASSPQSSTEGAALTPSQVQDSPAEAIAAIASPNAPATEARAIPTINPTISTNELPALSTPVVNDSKTVDGLKQKVSILENDLRQLNGVIEKNSGQSSPRMEGPGSSIFEIPVSNSTAAAAESVVPVAKATEKDLKNSALYWVTKENDHREPSDKEIENSIIKVMENGGSLDPLLIYPGYFIEVLKDPKDPNKILRDKSGRIKFKRHKSKAEPKLLGALYKKSWASLKMDDEDKLKKQTSVAPTTTAPVPVTPDIQMKSLDYFNGH